jgi:hypothetical protein
MSEQSSEERPLPKLNPEALKRERHDVDLGAETESGHDHVGHGPGRAPAR